MKDPDAVVTGQPYRIHAEPGISGHLLIDSATYRRFKNACDNFFIRRGLPTGRALFLEGMRTLRTKKHHNKRK